MSGELNRRDFIKGSTAAAAFSTAASTFTIVPKSAFGANDRIYVGAVGVGGRGTGLVHEIQAQATQYNVQMVAICDVFKPRREIVAGTVTEWNGKECKQYADYEEMLQDKDIDAVTIATPDFAHARILIDAMKAGKDAYIEKPFATELKDANEAVDVWMKSDCVVQVGTQRRSEGLWKAAAKAIQSGQLGTISRIEIMWNDCGPRWMRPVTDVKEEDVAWKRYLMDKKFRKFDPKQYRLWHLYRDFTNGVLALLGVHFFDTVAWVMEDPYPSTAVAHGGHYVWKDGREHEDTVTSVSEYPKGFLVEYTTGLGNAVGVGCKVYGTNGMFTDEGFKISGAGGAGKNVIKEEIKLTPLENESHSGNWMKCMRERNKNTTATPQTGHQHTVASILPYKALLNGRKMKYLPDQRKIVTA